MLFVIILSLKYRVLVLVLELFSVKKKEMKWIYKEIFVVDMFIMWV